MLVKPISGVPACGTDATDPAWLRIVAGELNYGELAVALYASDMPARKVTLSLDELLDLAAQGIARLSLDVVRERAAQSARNGCRILYAIDRGDEAAVARLEREYRVLFPKRRRDDWARARACRLVLDRPVDGGAR